MKGDREYFRLIVTVSGPSGLEMSPEMYRNAAEQVEKALRAYWAAVD